MVSQQRYGGAGAGIALHVDHRCAPADELPDVVLELLIELDLGIQGYWLFATTPRGVFAFVDDLSVWAWIEYPCKRMLLWAMTHPPEGIVPRVLCQLVDDTPITEYMQQIESVSEWFPAAMMSVVHPQHGALPLPFGRLGFPLPFPIDQPGVLGRIKRLLWESVYAGAGWETAFVADRVYQRFQFKGIRVTLCVARQSPFTLTDPPSISSLVPTRNPDIEQAVAEHGDGLLGPIRIELKPWMYGSVLNRFEQDARLARYVWLAVYDRLDGSVASAELVDLEGPFEPPQGHPLRQWLVPWRSDFKVMCDWSLHPSSWRAVYLMPLQIATGMSTSLYGGQPYRPPELICRPFAVEVNGLVFCYLEPHNRHIALNKLYRGESR